MTKCVISKCYNELAYRFLLWGINMEVKCQVVLRIYDDLVNNRKIYMNEVLTEYNISKRTFYRYISEINVFFPLLLTLFW